MQHAKRWITALVLIPVLLWILIKGSTLAVAVMVAVVAAAALREYLHIIFGRQDQSVSRIINAIAYLMSTALVVGASAGSWELMVLMLSMNLMALSVFVLVRFKTDQSLFDAVSRQVLGIIYIPIPLSTLVFVKQLDHGTLWIIWLLIVVFCNDTGALYSGTYLGKHLLSPSVSPKKTVEGAVGGALLATLMGLVFSGLFFRDWSIALQSIPCAFLLAAAGQVGDLFESAMKRASGVKDSGHILPGHGGMLDRIDGLLLSAPVLYFYLVFIL